MTEPKTVAVVLYAGTDRRDKNSQLDWRAHVDKRLDDGKETMLQLRVDIAANTETTLSVQADTSELVSLLKSFKGAFVVLDMMGKLARPLAFIVMCCTAVWGLIAVIKIGGAPK